MGILRLWLALMVVLTHTMYNSDFYGGGAFLGGSYAVEAFYIISGFYIQHILPRYREGGGPWIGRFYSSRMMRLLPVYYIVALIVLVYNSWRLGAGSMLLHEGNAWTVAVYIFSNLFLIGQDILRFTVFDPASGALKFYDYWCAAPEYHGSNFALLGQAWSMAVEIIFYSIAPFLLYRKTWVLVVLALLSAALKYYLHNHGYTHPSNWLNVFFPAELCLFLAGSLGNRFYHAFLAGKPQNQGWLMLLIPLVLIPTFPQPVYGFIYPLGAYEYLALVALCVPFLFHFSERWKLDREIGELSYPVYVIHMLAIQISWDNGLRGKEITAAAVVISILAAWFLVRYVESPLTGLRHRLFKSGGPLRLSCLWTIPVVALNRNIGNFIAFINKKYRQPL